MRNWPIIAEKQLKSKQVVRRLIRSFNIPPRQPIPRALLSKIGSFKFPLHPPPRPKLRSDASPIIERFFLWSTANVMVTYAKIVLLSYSLTKADSSTLNSSMKTRVLRRKDLTHPVQTPHPTWARFTFPPGHRRRWNARGGISRGYVEASKRPFPNYL